MSFETHLSASTSMTEMPDASSEVLYSALVQPSRTSATHAPVPLISAASVGAPHAQALLLYDSAGAAALDPATLSASLARVLTAYPQLAGRLTHPPNSSEVEYTRRFLRPWMSYGSDDPGFLLQVERRSGPLSAIAPSPVNEVERVYDLARLSNFTLAPELAGTLAPGVCGTKGPLSGVKITKFDDGAVLVVGTSHVLCDAGSLGVFASDWARVHAAKAGDVEDIVSELIRRRRFDWEDLDACAAGDLNSAEADPALVQREGELDVLRYDSWAGGAHPVPAPMDARPDPSLKVDSYGEVAPWDTLGTEAPRVYSLNFSGIEVDRITSVACAALPTPHLSANDALVAHLWRLISRARRQGATPRKALELSMACDVRLRMSDSHSYPDTPGCFNVCLGLQAPPESVMTDDGGAWAASRVRQAVRTVTPERVGAWLHRRAHDLDLRREMVCFPGTRSVCATNWARAGFSALDFGGGRPVFTHNLVPAFGGYATILKSCGGPGEKQGEEGKWYEPGVDVMLWLEESAMDRLVRDPALRG